MILSYRAFLFHIAEKDEYLLGFPDIPEIKVYGKTSEKAYEFAQKELKKYLIEYLVKEETLPKRSNLSKITTLPEEELSNINKEEVYQLLIPVEIEDAEVLEKTVQKCVSIPSYLNDLGKQSDINFSQLLTKALKKELNL